MKIKLSVVIITFNEEVNLARCLNSVQGIADEIIVVDSFSTDKTQQIAEEFGCKFFQHEFVGHIQQKNYALDLASHDYVLSLDADEELSQELKDSIKAVKENCLYHGYYFNRLSSYIDEFVPHGSWYPDQKLRLFNKEFGRWGGNNPHDEVILLSKKKKFLKGNLNHYTYYSITQHVEKMNYFSDIAAKVAFEDGKSFKLSDLLVKPFWRFFRDYFVKHGFLGGYRGLTISVLSSTETYLKIIKLWELQRTLKRRVASSYKGRVVHICAEKGWRGGEQQLAYLIEELRDHGYYNSVICKKNSAFEKYCLFNDIPYHVLPLINSIDLYSAWRLRKLCKREQADLMHMHSSKAHSIGAFSAILGNSTKMIVTRRVIFDIKKSAFSLWKYKLKAIKKVITISHAIHSHLLSYGLPKEKLRNIYSGISLNINADKEGVSLREEFDIPDSYMIVGNVSALTEEKDIYTFLKVAESVLQKKQQVKFIIFGNGILEDKLKQFSQELGIAENVIFGGFRKNVRSLISQFDVFLFTSIKEGLGTSVLDAMVAGTPVVITNAGGLKETITHEQDGYIVEVGDVENLAKWTIKLLTDDTLRAEIRHLAQESVKKFDIKKTGMETIVLYDEIINNERN